MATKKELEQALVQLRRIEEHRKAGAEKEIRRLYQELLKDLKQFIGFEYAELAEDGRLTYEILQQKGEYARFLEEAEMRMGNISPAVSREIKGLVEDTYTACYTGMVHSVNKASDLQELHDELQGLHTVTPETIKSVVQKGLVDEVLTKNWQENIYEIKRNIAVGLSQGDRVETMARRLSKTLDTGYKKAVNMARTESHRAREAGFHDSASGIDEALKQGVTGLRMVKTWRTMKDSRVRPNVRYKTKKGWKTKRSRSGANHQRMEGVMVLADEYFDLGGGVKTLAPGQSGDAKNDCNCRCYLSYDLMTAEEFEKATGRKLPPKEFTSGENGGIIKAERVEFTSGAEANKYFAKQSDELLEDAKATDAFRYWSNEGSVPINNLLRGRKEAVLPTDIERATDDTKAMADYIRRQKLQDDICVYRTMNEGVFENAVDSGVYRDKGFTATAAEWEAISGGAPYGERSVWLEITVPKGKGRGAYINSASAFKDAEYEYLIHEDAEFKILDEYVDQENRRIIRLELMK